MRNRLSRILAMGALLSPVFIGAAQAGDVTVTDGWIRALPHSVPSGGYFILHNGGAKPVTLTGADSPACGTLMLHKSENHGGMGGMTMMETVEVPPGGSARFAPGGYHLMCEDSRPMLQPGRKVPVTLMLAGGLHVTTQFDVRNATGK